MNNIPMVGIGTFIDLVEAQFKYDRTRAIMGLGKGGIGKSQAISDLAKRLNIGYVDIRLLLYSETDLKGIPYPDEQRKFTKLLQNKILPTAENNGAEGILVLDEIASAQRILRTAAYQLLNERKLGEYVLPEGWMIVCLGNGEEDGGDFQGLEANFANRCACYKVVSTLEDFKAYAISRGISDLIISYLSFDATKLHTFKPDDQGEDAILFASPRSWEAVDKITKQMGGLNVEDNQQALIIKGNLGVEVGTQFITFCKHNKSGIDASAILDGIEKRVPTDKEEQFILIQSLCSLMGDMIKNDVTLNGMITPKTLAKVANGVNYFVSFDSLELFMMAIVDFIQRDTKAIPKVLLNPVFAQQCPGLSDRLNKNKAVFSKWVM